VGRGIDLREHGSKNLGATNVYRILAGSTAIPVALFDIAKGAIPVLFFARWAGAASTYGCRSRSAGPRSSATCSRRTSASGGKGVATAAGMFLALAPVAVLLAILVWGICLWLTGYVSLSSILAVASVPCGCS